MSPVRFAASGLSRRPVRVRLALFSGILTAVILIGFAAVVGRLVSNRLGDEFREELRSSAAELAASLQVRRELDEPLEICLPVETAAGTRCVPLTQLALPEDTAIRIVTAEGEVAGGADEADAPPLGLPGDGSVRVTDEGLKVVDVPVLNTSIGVPRLWIQYARSPEGLDRTINRLWLFLTGGVLVGTLLAGFAGMSLANRAMTPIAELTSTARRIASTRDPSMRIPEPESDDEVAELARTLDEMLRELDAARGEIEQTIGRQREFVADASHELRTPLTSILANLELLEASLDERADEDDRAAARSALRSSRRMSRLVADLLIIARADAGRRGERVDCDLSKIAREAFEEVQPVAGGHELEAAIDEGAQLEGDPDELHRMILNLLENAIRHTPAGTRVRLGLARREGVAEISVEDNGPGLPEGAEETVFGRFVRGGGPADRSGSNGDSTGLGLAIVRAVARAHGGEVGAGRSALGGAAFVATLPVIDRGPADS